MLWNRNTPRPSSSTRLLGVDLNASCTTAVTASNGISKSIITEMPLTINLETLKLGPVASRKSPHLACVNYLSQLGVLREWRGRKPVTPESALAITFEHLKTLLPGEAFSLTLPAYLTATQIATVRELAARSKFVINGSASSALAIAAHRAQAFLNAPATEKPEWVVPLHEKGAGPGVVMIVEVDDAALTCSAIQISSRETRLLSSTAWPQASWKVWIDRILDSVSDRCVRLCRRDPRDSADAEQGLFDQLPEVLAKSRTGATVTLAARADKWYQDLPLTTLDFEAFSAKLVAKAMQEVREFTGSLPLPPKAVWLSQKASVLPGLAAALYDHSSEGADVAVLPAEAAAEAAAALDTRRLNHHCDGVLENTPPLQVELKTQRV